MRISVLKIGVTMNSRLDGLVERRFGVRGAVILSVEAGSAPPDR